MCVFLFEYVTEHTLTHSRVDVLYYMRVEWLFMICNMVILICSTHVSQYNYSKILYMYKCARRYGVVDLKYTSTTTQLLELICTSLNILLHHTHYFIIIQHLHSCLSKCTQTFEIIILLQRREKTHY